MFNQSIKISIFGESHQDLMGITVSKLAPGIKIDHKLIQKQLNKRRPQFLGTTKRVEADDYEIISGVFNGYTTGDPLTILVKNSNYNSQEYNNDIFRPSHSDYTYYHHSYGFNDYRGGGHTSGRLTVLIVIVGAIFKQVLNSRNIFFGSHILKSLNFKERCFENYEADLKKLEMKVLPLLNNDSENNLRLALEEIMKKKDSVGGIIESSVIGLPVGLGEPFFNSLESTLSHLIFSIPAIKGLEFGKGFNFGESLGSEVADEMVFDEKVIFLKNNNGGILGGMSTGEPLVFKTVVKPASSIKLPLKTITKSNENTLNKVSGRHDAAIFLRVPVVIDSMIAIALVDLFTSRYGYLWQNINLD